MRTVVWSEAAIDQWGRAIDYLAERNESAAAKLDGRIRETLAVLASRPIGRPGAVEGTFEKIVLKTPYLMIFEVVGDEVQILRLFHMSQDRRNWNKPSIGDL